MAKANTREPGVVKTTIGLASIASSDAVITPRADYGVTASKAKANTREPGVVNTTIGLASILWQKGSK